MSGSITSTHGCSRLKKFMFVEVFEGSNNCGSKFSKVFENFKYYSEILSEIKKQIKQWNQQLKNFE